MAGTIVNGQPPEADSFMNAYGSNFNDTAQNIFNADYIGFDSRLNNSGVPNFKNVDYDTFQTDSMVLVNSRYDSTNDVYEFLNVDDEIDNSDFSANWTASTVESGSGVSSTVVENTEYLQANVTITSTGFRNGTASFQSDGPAPIDYFNSNKDAYIQLRAEITGDVAGTPQDVTTQFGLTDGTNTVFLKTFTRSTVGSYSDDSIWEIYIDASANTADLYDDGVLDTANIDISSINLGNYYFIGKTETVSGSASNTHSSQIRLHYLYSLLVDRTASITSSGLATSETITNAIPVFNSVGNEISVQLAADGSTFESSTNTEIHRFSVTGTNLKTQIFITPTTIPVPLTIPTCSEFATKFNFY